MNGDNIFFPCNYKEYDWRDYFYTDFAVDYFNRGAEYKLFFLFMSYRAISSFVGPIWEFS